MPPVADPFLPALIRMLLQQFRSPAIMAFTSLERHFKKLRRYLLTIQAVLEDAEKRFTQPSVAAWLERLRDLAYELEDVLDEIIMQALVQHSNTIQQSRASIVSKLILACNSFAPSAILSNRKMVSKIKEITNRFQVRVGQRTKLNLSENSHIRSPVVRSPSTSLPTEFRVYGREEDQEAIIEMLLTDEEYHDGVSVISILGMGGIGKTTLAQLVYNDRNVKQNFHKRAWVCVSEEFDVISITRTLYESITGESAESKGLDMLQVRLKEELGKSKFLIVLDDVWNEDYEKWDGLRRPFQFGTPGSRIIVTTRSQIVASVVGSPRTHYEMKVLNVEDCLSILAQHSSLPFHENPEFKDLANKCGGLPLLATTLGGLLRAKETKEDGGAVLRSIIWDVWGRNPFSVLSLSYHNLPSHLKPLFAYCSIFPKKYDYKKNELIYLWMGEGFLVNLDESKSEEELGLEFFNELLSRSLFQRSGDSDEYFVMHDLIHDLARFAARGTCYHPDNEMSTFRRARHVPFLSHHDEVLRKFQVFNRARLRTSLPMPVQTSVV